MSAETHPWTLIDILCGQPAFHRVSIPQPCDVVRACDVEHIDGRPALQSEQFACDSCGRGFDSVDFRWMLNPANWRPRA